MLDWIGSERNSNEKYKRKKYYSSNKVEKSQSIKELGKKLKKELYFLCSSLPHIKLTNLLFIDERRKIKHLEGKFFFIFLCLFPTTIKVWSKNDLDLILVFLAKDRKLDLELISNFNAFLIEIIALLFSNKI